MQITKLSFLSTQSLGDSVFAIEEVVDIPIDQVFGSYRSREKALINLIGSDGVQKVSRDTWRIVKDITLEAANATMRQGDYFRVQLDEEGDDSPIHFDLDATGVFVLSRDVFASLQTYSVLEPGKLQSIRMQFTFGGKPVVDAKLTSKFSSLTLEPVDAVNGVYELQFYTAMAPSDDLLTLEITGVSLRNSVYEAPVRVTVREPILSLVPVDTTLHAEQTKDLTWQVLMEGKPAPVARPMQAVANPMKTGDIETSLIEKIGDFKLIDPANAIYSLNVKATDQVGAVSTIDTTYNFGSNFVGELPVPITLLSKESVYITHQTASLEANQTQLVQITLKRGATEQAPVTDATAETIVITGACIFSVDPELIVVDASKGIYAYRVTTNHKGGPITIRSVLSTQGNPYPDFYNLTARSTSVTVTPLNTLPAADTADLTFRVTQPRLGGVVPLVGVVAKTFTVGGSAIASINGPVEAVGQGVYKLNLTTNNRGGSVPVTATLTIDGEDVPVTFSTTAAALPNAVLTSTGPALTGETVQAVPLKVMLSGKEYDMTNPVVTVTGSSYVSNGVLRRTGVGLLEISDVNVNGKGGMLNVKVVGLVKGYEQTLMTTVAVNPVADVIATNVSSLRPTTTAPVQFTLTRGGVVVTSLKIGKATLVGGVVKAYDSTVETLDANTGRYQVRSVTATGPLSKTFFQISLPIVIKGYSYTVVFNSYVEAMPNLGTGGGSTSDPNAGVKDPQPGDSGSSDDGSNGDGSGTLFPGGNLSGGSEQKYCLSFQVDGKPSNITGGTVTGSGSVLVGGPNPTLEIHEGGIACITGIETLPDKGTVIFDGTIIIDDIEYPYHFEVHNNREAPKASNPSVLDCESVQTLYFYMKQGDDPVTSANLSDGLVTGDAIASFANFALDNAATGRYRVDVVTNDKGGDVQVTLKVKIEDVTYPVLFTTTAKSLSEVGDGTGWKLVSTAPKAASAGSLPFRFIRGGLSVSTATTKDLSVTGTTVVSSTDDIVATSSVAFKVTDVRLDNRAGKVTLKVSGSSNGGVTWHELSNIYDIDQASTPVVTPQVKMMVARKEAVLVFTLTRDGKPISGTITNVRVSGTPVGSAKQDVVVVNSAQGQYGTTLTPNDLGGNIDVTFDWSEGNVDYKDLSVTGLADIYHPWSATLVTGPKPEVTSYFDFQSHLDDGTLVALDSATAIITGDCLVTPVGEVSLVYQDASSKMYRIPNVMVNNKGGNLHVLLKGIYQGVEVDLEFDYVVAVLPDLQVSTSTDHLGFRTTTDLTFTVNRGVDNPSVFTNANVKNLTVTGAPIASFVPTVVQVSPGNYKVNVTTNSNGGPVTLAFTVTLAGIDYPISLERYADAEPPVTAASTNTLETNATATNLDFQLKRGAIPCADSFVVQSVTITGRSVSSYPQSVIAVNVSTGSYRMQVNTSAYSDDARVKIVGTVRGEAVTLEFVAKIVAGVLPTVTLISSSFDNGLLSSAQLSFLSGDASINGAVTLDSLEGPIDGATLNTTGVLSGTPNKAGTYDLTVNFLWKGALYSGTVSVNISQTYGTIVTGSTQLAAYKNNIVAFNMLNAGGNNYPLTGWTYALAVNGGLSTGAALTQLADGTFTIGLAYAGEKADTQIVLTATETASGTVRKHVMTVSFWFNFEARFSGTNPLDSTAVSNAVQFDVYETSRGNTFNMTPSLDSLTVKGRGTTNNITGWSSFTFPSNPGYRGTFYVSNNAADIIDADYSFNWVSGLGRTYKIQGTFRLQKPVVITWTDIAGAQGAVMKTLKFKLTSGAAAVSDASDTGTTVTNATINKAPYLIDAGTGTYGIDVTPSGSASSMVVTVKMKQASMATVIYTFAAQTVNVAAAAIIATATGATLRRQPSLTQNLDVQLTQGGVSITNATINSYTITGDSVQKVISGPTYVSAGTYRWTITTMFDGPAPKVTINATIGGVGYVFSLDYPIEAPAALTMTVTPSGTWTKNLLNDGVFRLQASGVNYDWRAAFNNGSTTVIPDGVFVPADNSFVYNGGTLPNAFDLRAGIQPLSSGSSVPFTFKVTLFGRVYTLAATTAVTDAGSITVLSGTPLIAEKANTIVFNLIPASGSPALDGTETIALSSKPSVWTTTTAPVRNPDGTYQVVFTPSTELAKQQFVVSVTKNGVTTLYGSPLNIDTRLSLIFGALASSEAAGSILSYTGQLMSAITSSVAVVSKWDLTVTGVVDATTLKLFPSNPESIDLTWTPNVQKSTGSLNFRFKSNMIDYATIRFSVQVTSPVTGLVYTIETIDGVYSDSVVTTVLGPMAIPIGVPTDVQYRMNYLTSGNPVTQAVMPTGSQTPGSASMVVTESFKVIDAANGIYAASIMPTTTADTASLTTIFRYMLPLSSRKTMTAGGSVTITAYRAMKMVFPAVFNATRTVPVTLRDANGIVSNATITGVQAGTYLDASSGSWTCKDTVNGIYMIPVTHSKTSQLPSNSSLSSANTVSETVSVTYTDSNGVSKTVPMVATLHWLPIRLLMPKTVPIVADGGAKYFPTASGESLASYTVGSSQAFDMAGNRLVSSANYWSDSWSADIGPGSRVFFTKGLWKDHIFLSGAMTRGIVGGTLSYLLYLDDFSIQRYPYFTGQGTTVNSTYAMWSLTMTKSGTTLPAQALNPLVLTLTDDLGAPVKGATMTAFTNNNFVAGTTSTQDLAAALVPVTDGSDGKYNLRLYCTGYTSAASGTFYGTFTVSAPGFDTQSISYALNVNL